MGKQFSLPKFTSPEKKGKKWLKWGLIVGGGLVVAQLAVLTVVAANRGAEASQQRAARAESARIALAARQAAARAEPPAPEPATLVEEALPPRAEGDVKSDGKAVAKNARNGGKRSGSKHRSGASKRGGAKAVASGAAPDKKPARRADAIDALLGQFR